MNGKLDTFATYNILPGPEAISSCNSQLPSNQWVRARAVEFLEDAGQLVVAYLNHDVV